ncbi:MAG TPA: hypothetical protein VFU32_10875 [Ktedonobacterales bacterium]|nr:hypothetical protein [Ktedonobacterales bacterium]
MCRMLDIAHQMQMLRIKRNPELTAALHYMTIDTPGGPQQVAMLESWAIAVWAAGLQIGRLSPASQEAARILKQHAYAAIARAFDGSPMAAETPTTFAAPTTRETEVIPSHSLDRIIAGMEEITEGLREVRTDYTTLEQRITILEQDRLGRRVGSGARLSAAQVGQLFMQLALLREQTGLSIEDAEKYLADQFGVAHIIDIDASDWPAVHQAILALFRR